MKYTQQSIKENKKRWKHQPSSCSSSIASHKSWSTLAMVFVVFFWFTEWLDLSTQHTVNEKRQQTFTTWPWRGFHTACVFDCR